MTSQHRKQHTDLFPHPDALPIDRVVDFSKKLLSGAPTRSPLDMKDKDCLAQLKHAQERPRSYAERVKARQPHETGPAAWDTPVRGSAAQAAFSNPRAPQRGFKADGVDVDSKAAAPTTLLETKRAKWKAEVGLSGSLAGTNRADTDGPSWSL